MDTSAFFALVLQLVGGLGLFLLGMKNMSEGMQAIAGQRLRRLIGKVTDNRFLATTTGVTVTMLVQSSSITTVMVVGFVNSGLMQLTQAIGVIMGANIGTTITGWILVLKIGKYGLPILGAAAFGYLFLKRDRWRHVALVLMGIGMIFFGLELMKEACAIIKETPEFEAWFQRFHADSYLGVLQCVAAGCVLTVLVQSSSATLGITISLAFQGIIGYETAAALVLGENVGTTITAILASLGATTNARRAAYFHVVFNLLGVFWIVAIFWWYIQLVPWVLGVDVTEAVIQDGRETFPQTTPAIAATHSIFNVANTLLFLPFVPVFARLLTRYVPSRTTHDQPHLTALDVRLFETPTLAIEQSREQILRMAADCHEMLTNLAEQMQEEEVLHDPQEPHTHTLTGVRDQVVEFITGLLASNLPHAVTEEAQRQIRLAHEFKWIGDCIVSAYETDCEVRQSKHSYSPVQQEQLRQLRGQLEEYLVAINEALLSADQSVTTDNLHQQVHHTIDQNRRQHLDTISKGAVPPSICVSYLAILNAFSRLTMHLHFVAQVLARKD